MIAAGAAAGVAGWALAVASLCAIAEIAAGPTASAGVLSSTWTPLTGIAAVAAGGDAFSGSFTLGPVALGLGLSLVLWVALGIAGVAAIAYVQGPAPTALGGAILGAAWGATALIAVVLLLVNGLVQDTPFTYDSAPRWGWWIAFVTGGGLLGAVGARALAGGEPSRPGAPAR